MKTALVALFGVIIGASIVAIIPAEAQEENPAIARDHRDKGWVGIHWQTDQWGGLELTHVQLGSPAWKAGLIAGDTIIGVEVLQGGEPVKEVKHGQSVPYLLAGLNSSAPGTEFKVYVKRGEQSLAAEKAFAVDFPREKIEVPAANVIIRHVREKAKEWQQAEFVWMTFKTESWNDFSDHAMRVHSMELARLQIAELREKARTLHLRRAKLIQEIRTLCAQERTALAEEKAAELAETDSVFGVLGTIIGLFFGF